jgi:hypothetical protein
MPPTRVVWNFAPWQMSFDGVPHVVRVPLLFSWAVDHLVHERIIGTHAILRPRQPGEAIDLAWWRARLGVTVDLGHVPESTHLPSKPCSEGPHCRTYLVVRVQSEEPGSVTVPVHVRGLLFNVAFETASSVATYVVDLDRVWFWSLSSPSTQRSVESELAGVDVTVVRREQSPNVLY